MAKPKKCSIITGSLLQTKASPDPTPLAGTRAIQTGSLCSYLARVRASWIAVVTLLIIWLRILGMHPFELWRYRSAGSSKAPGLLSPALPTYCYLHPQKKICLCTCFKECLTMAKCARLTALGTEILCSFVPWVQQEKGRWGAATGMGRGTTFSCPLPATRLDTGWVRHTVPAGPLATTSLLGNSLYWLGLEKSWFSKSSLISQKFEDIHNRLNQHTALG